MKCVGNAHEIIQCQSTVVIHEINGNTIGSRCTECRRRAVEWMVKNNKLPTLVR